MYKHCCEVQQSTEIQLIFPKGASNISVAFMKKTCTHCKKRHFVPNRYTHQALLEEIWWDSRYSTPSYDELGPVKNDHIWVRI